MPTFFTEVFNPDGLLVGGGVVTRTVRLTGATPLLRGAVLGMISATGFYTLSAVAAVDGSAVARAVLLADADPSAGDVAADIYDEGQFNEAKLIFGAGHTANSVREDLRAVDIHLKAVVAA